MKKLSKNAIGVGAALLTLGVLFYGNLIANLFKPSQMNQALGEGMPTTGVNAQDITVGTGTPAMKGDTITVNYVGQLTDGKVFDSSIDRGQPFTFTLGAGQVIRGWDDGLVGMKVGGTRRLIIAPDFGYGSYAVGPIPPNSTLIFDVNLLKVEKTAGTK